LRLGTRSPWNIIRLRLRQPEAQPRLEEFSSTGGRPRHPRKQPVCPARAAPWARRDADRGGRAAELEGCRRANACTAANTASHHPTARAKKTTYGAVARGGLPQLEGRPRKLKLKDPKDWTIAGKAAEAALDIPSTQGSPASKLYGIDFTLPGMLVRDPLRRLSVCTAASSRAFDAAKVEKDGLA